MREKLLDNSLDNTVICCIFIKKIMTKEKLEQLIENGSTRKCNCCNELLPVTKFYIQKDIKNNKHYRFNSPCKFCANINRDINYHKAYQRKKKYNLTAEEYELKLIKQNYACSICNIHRDDYSKDFAVDHCHKTGKVRALLCNNCNSGLGFFKENLRIIQKAIVYLKKYKLSAFPEN